MRGRGVLLAGLAVALLACAALVAWLAGADPAAVAGGASGAAVQTTAEPDLAGATRDVRAARASTTAAAPEPANTARAPAAPGTAIAGRVLHADGTPAVAATVGVFEPAAVDDGPASPFAPAELRPYGRYPTARFVRAWTATDAQGGFRLEDLDAGTWIVRADLGPLLAAATEPFVLREGATRDEVLLTLPPAAWITGHVLAPADADFEALCLELRANGEGSCAPWLPTQRGLRGTVDADGGFRLGPTEPGLHTIGVALDGGLRARGRPEPGAGPLVPVLDVYLAPGETERDLDLRSGFPGAIRVTVRMLDPSALRASRRPCVLVAEPLDPEREGLTTSVRGAWDKPLDSGPLAPGMWQVSIVILDTGTWRVRAPFPVLVEAARTAEVTLDVELARGSLLLRDVATGEALADAWVEIGSRAPDGELTSISRLTDESGRVEVLLPPGRYLLTAREEGIDPAGEGDAECAVVQWTIAGPTVSTVAVPR